MCIDTLATLLIHCFVHIFVWRCWNACYFFFFFYKFWLKERYVCQNVEIKKNHSDKWCMLNVFLTEIPFLVVSKELVFRPGFFSAGCMHLTLIFDNEKIDLEMGALLYHFSKYFFSFWIKMTSTSSALKR